MGKDKETDKSLINLHRITADPKFSALSESLNEKYGKM